MLGMLEHLKDLSRGFKPETYPRKSKMNNCIWHTSKTRYCWFNSENKQLKREIHFEIWFILVL